MKNENSKRLIELGGSDYEMADGQPDIRNWDVRNQQGQKIGEVDELIFEPQSRRVRYMVVDLDDNDLDLNERKVLLPIGLAELHRDDDDVILPSVTSQQLNGLPEYHADHLDAEMERNICTALGRDTSNVSLMGTQHQPEFYNHEHFNDTNLYKHRSTIIKNDENSAGMQLNDRSELRGSHMSGSTDDLLDNTTSYDTTREHSRSSMEEPMPVNLGDQNPEWSDRDLESRERTRNLMEGDNLTGDNIRNVQDDLESRNRRGGLSSDNDLRSREL
jgi:hypothetical protein